MIKANYNSLHSASSPFEAALQYETKGDYKQMPIALFEFQIELEICRDG
jgi:hypothetical protein